MSAGGERGWYLRRGRYQVGPFPVDEIAHLLQDGRIAEGDFARRSGSREWFPATRLHDEIGQSAQGAALPEPPAAVEAVALAGARNEAVNRLEVPQQRTGPASAGVVVRRVAGFAAAGTRWLRSRFSIESVAVLLSGILVVFLLTRLDYQELLGLPALSELSGSNAPAASALRANDLLVDRGTGKGIWLYLNDSKWVQVHERNARHLLAADLDRNGRQDAVVDFGPGQGIAARLDNGTWRRLHDSTAVWMERADLDHDRVDDLVVDFGAGFGIWILSGTGKWTKLHATSARSAVVADLDGDKQDDVVVDFGPGYGIFAYMNGKTWVQLHSQTANAMAAGDLDHNGSDELVIDFGPQYGIWIRFNNTSWVQLHSHDARAIAVGDLDGNGQAEVVVDFGAGYGVWVYRNNRKWVQLHGSHSTALAVADLDGNGRHDLIVDFAAAGLWAYCNDDSWRRIGQDGTKIVAGAFDGR